MDSIIFDVDGTLWDSTEIVSRVWTKYLHEKEKLDITITAEYLSTLHGMLLADIARHIFPDFQEEEQMRLIGACCEVEHEALLEEPALLYEGIGEALEELSKRYPLYIVSNCQAGYIELFLETTGFAPYFKGHLCPGDTGMAKGQNIMKIARDYNLKSPVYVGDTFGDYTACQEAGVPFIFASYGFGEVEKPWKRIEKPAELLEICK